MVSVRPHSITRTRTLPSDSGFGRPLDGVIRTAVGHPPLDQPELLAFGGQWWSVLGHEPPPQPVDHRGVLPGCGGFRDLLAGDRHLNEAVVLLVPEPALRARR